MLIITQNLSFGWMYETETITRCDEEVGIDGCCFVKHDGVDGVDGDGTSNGDEDVKNETHL